MRFFMNKNLLWLAVAFAALLAAAMILIPIGGDFHNFFLPAGAALSHGKNPYTVPGFYNPFWLAVFFIPFSWLPERLSWGLFLSFSIILYIFALKRLGVKNLPGMLLMASPFVFYSLCFGNIDSFVLLGATLPAPVGVWLLLLKPQMSIGLLAFWAYKAGSIGWKRLLFDFGPVCLTLAVFWGLGWRPRPHPIYLPANLSAWPWGILPGLVLTWLGIRQSNTLLALSASPFFSPYNSPQTWIVSLLPAHKKPPLLFFGFLLSWVFVILRMQIRANALRFEPALLVGWGVALILINLQGKKAEIRPKQESLGALNA